MIPKLQLLVSFVLTSSLLHRALSFSHLELKQHQTRNTICWSRPPLNRDATGRRSFLLGGALVATTALLNPIPAAQASEVRGPVELLRPATRVKVYLEQAIATCQKIKSGSGTLDEKSFNPLVALLFDQQPIFSTQQEELLAKRYLEIDTSSAWQAARLKEREARGAELGIDYTTPYDRLNTAVQQFGDRRTFQILRQRQRGLEQNNAMRAAFNAYTNNLVFGNAYQLNAQGDTKKTLVRNDALPDVNAVVVSDLDLRDLYRNQVLQNFDDAKAEVSYQLKTGEYDVDEILNYLGKAQSSCNDWFAFIPKADVEEALLAVRSE